MHFEAIVNDSQVYSLEMDPEKQLFIVNGQTVELDKVQTGPGRFHFIHNNRSFNIEILPPDRETKQVVVVVNGNKYAIKFKDRYDDLLKSMGMESSGQGKHRDVKAPMPGMVIEVMVKEGDQVEKDTPLLILEAMKMENVIKSPGSGTISKVVAHKGQAVEKNSVLVEFS